MPRAVLEGEYAGVPKTAPKTSAPPISTPYTRPASADAVLAEQAAQQRMADAQKTILRQGSSGDAVRTLQQALVDRGYDVGGVDAQFGPKTAAALQKFQRDAGIQVDAVAGPETWGALATAEVTSKQGDTQAPVSDGGGGQATGQSGGQNGSGTTAQERTTVPAESQSAPPAVNQYTSALGAKMSFEDVLRAFREGSQIASLPYESAIQDLIANMPKSPSMTPGEIAQAASRYAGLIVDPQELALTQELQNLQGAAATGRQNIEAAYAGAEQAANRLLAEAENRARRDAVRRKGSRAGLLEYLMGEYGQPVTEQFTQAQAQRAASLSEIERNLLTGQQQIGQRREALGAQRGALQAQQQQALEDLMYARQTGDWSRALAATQALMGAATQATQFGQNLALSLMPYTELTEYERQMFPLLWSQTMYQTPGGSPTTADLLRQMTGAR